MKPFSGASSCFYHFIRSSADGLLDGLQPPLDVGDSSGVLHLGRFRFHQQLVQHRRRGSGVATSAGTGHLLAAGEIP